MRLCRVLIELIITSLSVYVLGVLCPEAVQQQHRLSCARKLFVCAAENKSSHRLGAGVALMLLAPQRASRIIYGSRVFVCLGPGDRLNLGEGSRAVGAPVARAGPAQKVDAELGRTRQ